MYKLFYILCLLVFITSSNAADDCQALYNLTLAGCPIGTYFSADNCILCPSGGSCLGGDEEPLPDAGFIESETIPLYYIECPIIQGCPEYNARLNYTSCGPGYDGFLCADCYTGFFRSYFGLCIHCPDKTNLMIFRIIAILIGLLVSVYLLHRARNLYRYSSTALFLRFVQNAALISSYPINLLPAIQRASDLSSISNINIDFLPFSCMFTDTYTYFFSWAVKMLFPFIMIAILLAIVPFYVFWQRCVNKELTPWREMLNPITEAYVIFIQISHIPLTYNVLEYFMCIDTPDGSYLQAAPYLKCGEGIHLAYRNYAIAGLVFYTLGIPLGIFLVLYHYRNRLQDVLIFQRIGSLFRIYKFKYKYWEVWVRFRALLLMIIPAIFVEDGVLCVFSGYCVLAFSLGLSLIYRPMLFTRNNAIAEMVDAMLMLMFMGALSGNANGSHSADSVIDIIITSGFGLAILIFIHASIYEIYYFKKETLSRGCFSWVINTGFFQSLFPIKASFLDDFLPVVANDARRGILDIDSGARITLFADSGLRKKIWSCNQVPILRVTEAPPLLRTLMHDAKFISDFYRGSHRRGKSSTYSKVPSATLPYPSRSKQYGGSIELQEIKEGRPQLKAFDDSLTSKKAPSQGSIDVSQSIQFPITNIHASQSLSFDTKPQPTSYDNRFSFQQPQISQPQITQPQITQPQIQQVQPQYQHQIPEIKQETPPIAQSEPQSQETPEHSPSPVNNESQQVNQPAPQPGLDRLDSNLLDSLIAAVLPTTEDLPPKEDGKTLEPLPEDDKDKKDDDNIMALLSAVSDSDKKE